MTFVFYVVTLLLCSVTCEKFDVNRFSHNFMFGVSTSAYQIEGAWNESEKGENIWDRFTHERSHLIADKTNGDISCDSYHKIQEDVKLLKELGVNFYKFSFSWSRILPKAFSYKINDDAIRYYNDLINLLIANNIQPVATIFNWDLPQIIQEIGGFSNVLITEWFADYAKVLFKNFGDRVKFWITINEPQRLCLDGYGGYKIAPGMNLSYSATYECGHNILKSHAKVYHLYKNSFKSTQNGQVSIALEINSKEPTNSSTQDVESSQNQQLFFWFADPIFGNGDYPIEIKDYVKQQSLKDGFKETRLPAFTNEESHYIQGTGDFCAINYYDHVRLNSDNITAKGFRQSLNFIKEKYGDVPILVVGNGVADKGEVNDYYRAHLGALMHAILEDNVNVMGYGVWTLFDNFDWNNGYLNKYGLYYVNFTDPERKRVAKLSAKRYSELLKTRTTLKNDANNLFYLWGLTITAICVLRVVLV